MQAFLNVKRKQTHTMATGAVVDVDESLPGPSRSYSTAPVHKWTCAALKTWLKARGLSYSGMKKDELVAK